MGIVLVYPPENQIIFIRTLALWLPYQPPGGVAG